jgi:signal transduction histidine kinase
MKQRLFIKVIFSIFSLLVITFSNNIYANKNSKMNIEQNKVINAIKKAEDYIKNNGKDKAIAEFKKSSPDIFAIAYDGTFLASSIYPEMIGTNQINYRDPSGVLVVQEEIEKAKAGGGWLKGRWRKNPQTGKYGCRKIYIQPMKGDYLIGSWYFNSANKKENCLIS